MSMKKTKVVIYGNVGMEVDKGVAAWKAFKERLLDKASKAMHATWGMGMQSGSMSARGGMKLCTAFVRPVLPKYGSGRETTSGEMRRNFRRRSGDGRQDPAV